MTDEPMTDEPRALVLSGTDGARYAIPFEALEHFRLPDDATIDEPEVEGFGWGWNWNVAWTPPNQLISRTGASLIGDAGTGFRNNRYWG